MTDSNSVVQLPGSKIIPAEAGVAIFPRFSAEERAQGLTDFNDLATQNADVVSRSIG
jgi:hypothetical protein